MTRMLYILRCRLLLVVGIILVLQVYGCLGWCMAKRPAFRQPSKSISPGDASSCAVCRASIRDDGDTSSTLFNGTLSYQPDVDNSKEETMFDLIVGHNFNSIEG
jgi:hypothetical protein